MGTDLARLAVEIAAQEKRLAALKRYQDEPEPSPNDLKPFLGGLSPGGPSHW